MNELQDQVIDDIRSCLISSKGGVPVSQINRDYRMIVGESIPYVKLGYQNLEAFLSNVPGLNVHMKGGEMVLEALPSKNTLHITTMVRQQKSSGTRRKQKLPNIFHKPARLARNPVPTVTRPVRRVILPEGPKRPPPTQLTALSKANAQQRLKAPPTRSSPEPIMSSQNTPGNRRSFGELETSPYQEDALQLHGNQVPPLSPLESNSSASSVLRTPTGVLSPGIGEFGMSSSGMRTSPRPPPPAMSMPMSIPPVIAKRTSAQARLTRQVSKPVENNTNTSPSVAPPYEVNPVIPKTTINQSTRPTILENKNIKSSNDGNYYSVVLDQYCKLKGLPDPVYKILQGFPKSAVKAIVCSIKVGSDRSFSSYPAECKTEEEAREVAAKDAFDTLEKIYGVIGESLPCTTDENLLITRIVEILDGHPNGLWSSKVVADYRGIYKERMPDSWFDIVQDSPVVHVESAAQNRYILSPMRHSSDKELSRPNSTASSGPMDDLVTRMDELTGKLENDDKIDENTPLGQLSLPEDEYWNVYVSYVTSTTNVWIRLIGDEYSVLYDDMAAEMEMAYMNNGGKPVEDLAVGHYYALQVEECWHRVELTELYDDTTENGEITIFATCFFVDNGDEETQEASKLKTLDPRFRKLPCQAVQCRLAGLEDFASDRSVENIFLEMIFGHNFVAKASIGESEEDGESRTYPSLILIDTSTDDNINLNEVILEKLLQDAPPPALLKNGKIQEAYVSYISQSGSLYIQVPTNNFDVLIKLIEDFSANISTEAKDSTAKINAGVPSASPGEMYLAQYDVDKLWYRAVVDVKRPEIEDGKVWVKFVDYGNYELISLKEMVLLPSSNVISKLPYQAIECRFHNMSPEVQFTKKGLNRCREIIPADDPVLVKVVSSTSDSGNFKSKYEVVEIFKRVQPDNLLASVGTTLSVEEGMFEKSLADVKRVDTVNGTCENGSNKPIKGNKTYQKSPSFSTGVLPTVLSPPKVPNVGEFFDVQVTMAANPGNFTVQPWMDYTVFSEMMTEIQEVYSQEIDNVSFMPFEEVTKYRQPLDKEQVIEGGFYAALHEDQVWYRITVSKIINLSMSGSGVVSAYFVDYGDVAVIMMNKIRKLAPRFFNLPYQAVKAKLSGIAPVHSDWSVEDCVHFQELVCDKQFVATVVETGPDLIDPSHTVIGLHLTDTSDPAVDSSIGQILIDEGRAIAC